MSLGSPGARYARRSKGLRSSQTLRKREREDFDLVTEPTGTYVWYPSALTAVHSCSQLFQKPLV
jgi:hypothetical protein